MKRLLLIALFLAFAPPVYAQPSWSSLTSIENTGTSCSGSVTSSGTDRLLVAAIHINAGTTVSNADFNGAALTFIAGITNTGNFGRTEIWYRAAPASGTLTFTANFSSSTAAHCHIHILTNAHQTLPLGNSGTASTSDTGTTLTINLTSATTELIIDAITGAGSGWGVDPCAPGSTQTERYDTENSGNLTCGSTKAGAVSASTSWTLTGGGYLSMVSAAFKPPAVTARRRASPMVFP